MKEFFSKLSGLVPPFVRESIRIKLALSFFLLAVLPLILLGGHAYLSSVTTLRDEAEKRLETLASTRAAAIRKHIRDRNADMMILYQTVDSFRTKAFNQLSSVQQLKKSLVETYFTERLSDVNVMSRAPITARAMSAFRKINGPVGGAGWKQVEKVYGPYLVQFTESYGYYDAYLVSADGEILYTVAQESDLGQNLITGDLKDGPAGKAFRKGLNELTFQDFESYAPADGAPAAFIASPIKSGGQVLGVIMVQASVDQINYIMQERTGLGKTGESYLVGPEGYFRSDSIHIDGSTIMNTGIKVSGPYMSESLQGNSGEGIIVNFRNEYVLAAWAPVRIQDLTWVMVSEIDISEAFVPKGQGQTKDFFTNFKESYGFEDLALMDRNGYIFYSVMRKSDFRTNLLTGDLKDTEIAKVIRDVVLPQRTMRLTDFAAYPPMGNDSKAAFVAIPILSKIGEVDVVAVAQLSIQENNEVMMSKDGLGETGETYLVGTDFLFRSGSRYIKNSVMNPKHKVQTEAVKKALKGETGIDVIEDYRGVKVLTAYSFLDVVPKRIRWAIISQVDMKEVRQPANEMAFYIIIGVFVVILIVVAAYFGISRGLTRQVEHIMDLFGEIGMGNFTARTEVDTQDELGVMASSLNAMLDNTMSLIQSSEERDSMQGSIMHLLEEISGLADGDLTARAEVTEDFTGAIADSFNEMAEQLGRVVRHVKDVTIQVSATSKEVSSSTENLAETSEMQAVQVSDAIAAINEMAASIQQVAENASQSAGVSEEATKHSKEGAEAVRMTNKAMESIREHVQETARAIKRLGESSQEVGNIVQLINDIADRTSILALNASIQAAMAGEAGRGFAVVAEEVQRLAERSTNATKQIDTLIKNIQGEINEAGSSMEESIQRVVEGSKLADGAYAKLQEIENVTTNLGELIQSISMASKQQARASENIAKTMEEVGDISAQTSAASRQTAVAMQSLAETSDQLNETVSVFKLGEGQEEEENTSASAN